jgi:uncharacterized protein (UPF0332 family)
MIDDLIDIADMLAAREEGRPKQASLKRAVSTAYYALFHELADLCGRELIGHPNSRTCVNYRLIYRSLDHGNARKILDPKRDGIGRDSEITLIGLAFSNLQRERHTADYDPEFTFSRSDAVELIEQAKQAIGALRSLPAAKKKSLAAQLIARVR